MAQIAEIKASINAAQEVIGWDVIFNVERVKQSLLSARQLSHHAANPPAGRRLDLPQAKQEIYFFNRIDQKQSSRFPSSGTEDNQPHHVEGSTGQR